MNDEVAVVIPTHERPGLVGRAIASALAQTSPPARIVVVDDMADAATQDVVESHASRQPGVVTYLALDPRSSAGASLSRNTGAALCTEPLIAFLDDDDWWDERYLEQALATRAQHAADLIVTPTWMVVDGVREEWMQPSPRAFEGFRPGVSGSNILLTREAFERVRGFDTDMWVMNDVDFFVRLREAGTSVAAASERLVCHEGRGAGHLTSPGERRAQGLEHFLAVHGDRMDRDALRLLRRRIHSARITAQSGPFERLRHRLGVAWYSTPADVRGTLERRLRGRQRAH